MKVSERLIHELLDLTRMYSVIPYNSIFLFVAYDEYRNIDFFESEILSKLNLDGFPMYVVDLVGEIKSELVMQELTIGDCKLGRL